MSKTFPQESSETFLNFKKVYITQNKKKSASVFQQSALKITSKKRHGFQKRNFLAHSPSFE